MTQASTAAFPFDAIGFDLDGTLLDTHRDLGAAVNYALDLGGFDPVPVNSSKDLIGGGAKVMLARAVDAQGGMATDDFRALYKKMLAFYAENNAVHTVPYPGVEAMLDACDDLGLAITVITNKFEEFALNILTHLGLADRFVTIIGGDSLGRDANGTLRAKPMPDPLLAARERCGGGSFAFVGDSSYDVRAARAAQVPVVVAGYGYCDDEPRKLGGDAVADDVAGILPALWKL